MRHPELPIAAFLSVPLVLCSLPSHARAGSVCTMALIAWLAVVSIIRGANALLWAGNVDVKLEVWCDITTKITVGFTYAVPASALCVLRHLESVSSTRNVRTTKSDKRRRQRFEAIMCFVIPAIGMALHYIVQGHRLDIIEDFGCYPPVYFSIAAIMILWVPPFIMSLASFVYAGMALRHFLQRRIEFAAHLRNSHSSISPGRYFRLMALAVGEMIWDTGVNAYLIYFNSFTGLRPWISWENVHSNFSRVAVFPKFIIPAEYITQMIWQWWIVPISCIFFFVFFAFGEEAMSDYRAAILWCRRTILRQSLNKSSTHGSRSVLPTYRPNVNITLPTISDDASEQEAKAWDSMSLKMPEITEHVALPSTPDSIARMSPYPTMLMSESHGRTMSEKFRSHTLENSESSASMDTSEVPSSATAGWSGPSSPFDAHIAHRLPPLSAVTVTITSPESEVSLSNTHFVTPSTTPTLPPAPCRVPSRPTSYRRSTSTDLGISVSPAYLPDAATTSRYHEEAFLTPAVFGDAALSPPDLAQPHPHGGIRLTVEKNVV